MASAESYSFETVSSFSELPLADYRRLLGPAPEPFLRPEMLLALEESGCASADHGWAPCHVLMRRLSDQRVVAIAPAYAKGHSMGEFVFDHGWARFAESRLRIPYYPKLVLMTPFTPATGQRILLDPELDSGALLDAFVSGLGQLIDALELSSAHVLFPHHALAKALEARGLSLRVGLQYHWKNAGYAGFDDFLARFPARKRKQLKRERRELREQGVHVERLTGAQLTPALADLTFELYASTVDKFHWGQRYLNRAFFEQLFATAADHVLIVLARDGVGGRPLGLAFDLVGERALFGRYWGAREQVPFLHFEVCYYQGIEYCIERGLELFEPGAGGEHKESRGFPATRTYSAHVLRHPALRAAVGDFVARERAAIDDHLAQEEAQPLLKPVEPAGLGEAPEREGL